MGIENSEVPLVQFEIVIDGGLLLEDMNKVGVSNLMARMMTQGTKNKTPAELEEAIQQLGATINVICRYRRYNHECKYTCKKLWRNACFGERNFIGTTLGCKRI